jgi:glycerol uptake facilitator-like aquaporin
MLTPCQSCRFHDQNRHVLLGVHCFYYPHVLHVSSFSSLLIDLPIKIVSCSGMWRLTSAHSYALQDNGNLGAGNLTPLGLFFVIFGIGACFGWETGYAINLARDFGPRLMSYCLGYGPQVFEAGNYYFWVRYSLFHFFQTAGLTDVGPDSSAVLWLCIWRLAVRCIYIHR